MNQCTACLQAPGLSLHAPGLSLHNHKLKNIIFLTLSITNKSITHTRTQQNSSTNPYIACPHGKTT